MPQESVRWLKASSKQFCSALHRFVAQQSKGMRGRSSNQLNSIVLRSTHSKAITRRFRKHHIVCKLSAGLQVQGRILHDAIVNKNAFLASLISQRKIDARMTRARLCLCLLICRASQRSQMFLGAVRVAEACKCAKRCCCGSSHRITAMWK
jgi:hypothetical protein